MIVEAIVNMTNIVESMHHRLSPISKRTESPQTERARGLAGLVYKSIRSLTELVGKSLDAPLGIMSELLSQNSTFSSKDRLLSALNGVLGDHLVKRNSSLAIPMALRKQGIQLAPNRLAKSLQQSNGKLVIMIHGLCMNDLQWKQKEHDHGKALETDLGYTAVYLHYNTGLHISENGKLFAHMLEQLISDMDLANIGLPLDISIVAHSMGGLVTRSALQQANIIGHQWPDRMKNIVFLGTPHHGAPLEKAGNWMDLLLGVHAYTSPLKGLLRIRSAGITDLRHGNLIESDWHQRSRFDFSKDKRTPVALPENVNFYTVATTASAKTNNINEQLVGDGLVPIDSALGKHQTKAFTLDFAKSHQWIGRDINHMQLLSNPEVYTVIKNWLVKNSYSSNE
ncbi:permease [Aliiglaciecola litoralis]|uniref:Permease n=1 Tax=Aliiglaciecola litoralis TaxID=582857 RepID=A0ABP3X3X7_9ALTE